MNFTNPIHLDYIIFTNVTNLVYHKNRQTKIYECKGTQYIPHTQEYKQFYNPTTQNNQKTIINSNQPAPYPTATFKQPSPKKTATITLPTYKVRKVDAN